MKIANALAILVAAATAGATHVDELFTGNKNNNKNKTKNKNNNNNKNNAPDTSARCYASTSSSMAVSSSSSMTKGQSQREMESSSLPASHTSLRRGDGDMRKLATKANKPAPAAVIHYTEDSWTLSREEVANAVKQVIDGDQTNFQLDENFPGKDAMQVLLITDDGMTISREDLDEAFTIKNAFIEKKPDTKYQVDCPAKVEDDTCTVKELGQQDEAGNDLVTCFAEDSTIKKETIPAECDDEMYDMALYALPGPHFILAGTKSLDSSSVNPICPKSIAFSTSGQIGRKQIVSPYMEDIKDLPKHTLGVAALADVLEAEENAEAIDEASYDMLNNNCVHYASSIWRRLEFDETEALGNFVVHNIVIDEELLETAASEVQGGRRLLKAMLNKRLEDFVKNVVYEYFDLN